MNFRSSRKLLPGQDDRSGKPFVVVAGLDSLQGLQSARIFARHDVPVIGIAADPGHFCCRTNVCRDIRFTDIRGECLVTLLEQMGPGFAQQPVLLPCQDETVLMVSRHRERLARWYRFSLPERAVVELATDKSQFYQFAEDHGFLVPKTFLIRDLSDLATACRQLAFPCILKPKSRCRTWKEQSAFKAFKVNSCEELLHRYEACRHWCDVLVLQEWIPGTDAELYSCNGYFDAASTPLVTFVARKLRQWPPEAGMSCLGEECRNDVVLKESVRLFHGLGLRGLGYLEMKRDPRSGRHVIIEPNIGRPTGRSAIAEAGGVELLYTMYCDLLGWPLPEARTQLYTGVKWIHLLRDCASALYYWRQGQLSLSEWRQSLRGNKAFAVFSVADPAPFCGDLQRVVQLWLSPRERRRRMLKRGGCGIFRESSPDGQASVAG